jgi:hypothetical protein
MTTRNDAAPNAAPAREPDQARRVLRQVIAYCQDRWTETGEAGERPFRTADVQIGRQSAYTDVMRYVHTLLADLDAAER